MFCDSKNDPDEVRPNVNVCPICVGHPGTLPVMNKEAVRHVLKVGLALGGRLADFTEFDRKNYFYPDIPKGYQLSQYEFPLVSGGSLQGVAITRVHLEEDTATSLHEEGDYSLVDFNRAGIPLMELVTEPVIKSAAEAANFARELQLLLRYIGASDANMEKGEMRVEANISVSKATEIADKRRLNADGRGNKILRNSASGQRSSAVPLGTKVEVKNLNSFRAVERAIAYEMGRHIELIESGKKVEQETRGWDENTGKTFVQRKKEESHDYRYFPDPDLSKLVVRDVPEFASEILKKEMPRFPWEKRRHYIDIGIKAGDAEILLANRAIGALLEAVENTVKGKSELFLASNYIISDLLGLIRKAGFDGDSISLPFSPTAFAKLIGMVADKKLSSRGAKDILQMLFEKGGEPEELAAELGLLQKSDRRELKAVVEEVIAANQKVALDYKSGKMPALQFLVGQGMKATKGSANPEVLREVFTSLLK